MVYVSLTIVQLGNYVKSSLVSCLLHVVCGGLDACWRSSKAGLSIAWRGIGSGPTLGPLDSMGSAGAGVSGVVPRGFGGGP